MLLSNSFFPQINLLQTFNITTWQNKIPASVNKSIWLRSLYRKIQVSHGRNSVKAWSLVSAQQVTVVPIQIRPGPSDNVKEGIKSKIKRSVYGLRLSQISFETSPRLPTGLQTAWDRLSWTVGWQHLVSAGSAACRHSFVWRNIVDQTGVQCYIWSWLCCTTEAAVTVTVVPDCGHGYWCPYHKHAKPCMTL